MNKKDNKIAIVGMACRLPGKIKSPDDYWQVLSQGKDVVTEISSDRWGVDYYSHPDKKEPGKTYTFAAGVLDDIDLFDPAFFGISPREADQMDPQQRLLLELAWETIEDAGLTAETIKGSDCAVYMGIASNDYAHRRTDDLASLDAYTMTGNTASVASNRISYTFDLRGPSVSVDTACSSSLVAIHQACKTLWTGESSMTLCGGINMLVHPFPFVGFSKASMLSPDGRCKAFDNSGNGYVRSEGAGMLLLKPLAAAERDGDNIHAVIVNSGVNCDGHTSGITVPGMETQSALLDRIYGETDVKPEDLSYLEAHGTGTAVGDPLEATALGNTLGKKRKKDSPLRIGSAKTNLGHLETASGMAGLLKATLALKNREIPASLHFREPNENINFEDLNLEVVTQPTPLEPRKAPHYIGINSFGFGGANAHILLEEYKPDKTIDRGIKSSQKSCPPLILSAKSEASLRELAGSYAELITASSHSAYADIAYSARYRRSRLPEALALTAKSPIEVIESLQSFASSKKSSSIVTGEQHQEAKLAFVFSGNGCQSQGMGQALYDDNDVFRQSFDTVSELIAVLTTDYSLKEELFKSEEESSLAKTEIAQPLLFAIQVGVIEVLKTYGIQPKAVLGHSVGEVAAAWASGALSLTQACSVIFHRSQAQGTTSDSGKMAAVGLSKAALLERLTQWQTPHSLEIAGINGANAITVAGSLEDLMRLEAELKETGEFYRLLDLNYAFHSQQMNPIEAPVKKSLDTLEPMENHIRFISTVTGEELSGDQLNADYWWKNIREPVQFYTAITTLIEEDFNVFVEIGPHPILRSYVSDSLKQAGKAGLIYETLKRKQDSGAKLHNNAMKIILSGCEIEESRLFPTEGKYVKLPSYPWQRERYWYPLTSEGYDLVNRTREHPLLGYRLKDSDIIWENNLDTSELAYLADHVVDEAIVLPAAAYIEMALAASKSWLDGETQLLEMVEIPAPIILEANKSKKVRFHLDTTDGSFKICSRDRLSDDEWTQNATGRLLGQSYKAPVNEQPLFDDKQQVTHIDGKEHYELATMVGLEYGSDFQAVTNVQAASNMAIASLRLPKTLEAGVENYLLHPSILDSGFQVLVDVCRDAILAGERKALIPVQVGRLHLYENQASHASSIQVEITRQSPRSVVANFVLKDSSGKTLAELQNCRFRQLQLKCAVKQDIGKYHYTAKLQAHPKLITKTSWGTSEPFDITIKRALESVTDNARRTKHFHEFTLLADLIAAGYTYQAIYSLAKEQQHFHIDELLHQIDSEQTTLLHYLLGFLENNSILTNDDGTIIFSDETPDDVEDIWLNIIHDSPEYLPELLLLSQCGQQLEKVLKGELSHTNLIHSEKSSLFEQMMEVGPSYQTFNRALSQITTTLATELPENKTFRLLLISELPEQQLSHLLPVLSGRSSKLVLASSNEAALSSAERLIEDYEWASCIHIDDKQLMSMSTDTPYDVIILSHVLHQANNISGSLLALRSMLNTNGRLLVLERSPDSMTNLTFGCNPSWWHQGHARMISPDEWLPAFEKAGFEQCTATNETAALLDEGVFLISAVSNNRTTLQIEKASTNEHWLILKSEPPLSANTSAFNKIAEEHGIALTFADHNDDFEQLSENTFYYNALSADSTHQLLTNQTFDRIIVIHDVTSANILKGTNHFNSLLLSLEQLKQKPQLVLVTQGAAMYDEATVLCPANSPVWGLGRVIMNEYPDLKCRCIDINPNEMIDTLSKQLVTEILENTGESEIILGSETRHVLRLEKVQPKVSDIKINQAAALDFKIPGSFKNLYWKALLDTELKADEIEIQPVAAGLNFRDLMYAMGLLSDEAVENGFAGATLGMEVSGTVTRIGSGVVDYKIGDEVLGFSPACFSNRVITQTTATAHKPASWSFEEAATVPTAFFTVYYAFVHLAQLQPGENVMIHGASGGVGLAAVQLAKHLGATVFAAAGTHEKRSLVKKMGVDFVLDSRSLAFEEDILRLTNGEGVDVVLNSVYGEAVNRNLAILKPFGRFLELGKRDFYENSRIGLRPFRNNITYFGIDADQLLIERIDLAKRLFSELMQLFNKGHLHPLPYRVFEAARIQDAFRYMQQSRQIGKVVVSIPEALPVTPEEQTKIETLKLDPNANYLVTGGMSGFGLQTAKWLVDKGAKHLTLLGRKGLVSETAINSVETLRKAGVIVHTPACDIGDKQQVEEVFNVLSETAPPLKGIIHAAAIFEDGLLRNLTTERMESVLSAKALGAWNIHEVLEDHDLNFFVMYSSATTLFGNPGQGNYVAANYALENLTAYRRSKGLTASYAAWGAISDVGILARNTDTKDSLVSRLGGSALTSTQALDELEKLILSGEAGAAFIDFDWKAIKRAVPSAKDAKFTEQNNWLSRHGGDSDTEDFFSKIEGMTSDEIQKLIAGMLTKEISHILRLPIEKVDQNCSVYDLGMDSLMGMELLMAIESKFNTKLPLMTLSEGGSIKKIAEKIHAKINNRDSEDNLIVEDLALKHGAELSEESLGELKKSSSG